MKNIETAKQIFKSAFEDYCSDIIKKMKKETCSLDGASFFIKRKMGISSGKDGFLTAHKFLNDINNPDIHSVTELLSKMTEYPWGMNSRTVIKTCLSNVMDNRYFDSVPTIRGSYDWMACVYKITHAGHDVSDVNLTERLIAELETSRIEAAREAAERRAIYETRDCRGPI